MRGGAETLRGLAAPGGRVFALVFALSPLEGLRPLWQGFRC